MKKSVYAVAIVVSAMLLATSSVQAEESPHQGHDGGAMQQQDPQSQADRQAEEALELKNRKEEMLLKITNRIAQMQKAKDCISAAATREALHSCMPKPQGGGKKKGGGHGMMGGQGMMMGDGDGKSPQH